MFNKLIKFGAVISLAASPSFTYAETIGWTGEREVVEVVAVVNGGINVRLSPDLSNCVSQSGYGDKYASISSDHAGLQIIQSNLLAAMMSGKKVSLHLGDAKCYVTEMRVFK